MDVKTKPIELSNRNRPKSQAPVPPEYRQVARGMEQQFARLMVDEMRKTVPKSTPASSEQAFYESLLDQRYSEALTDGEGLGLQKLILEQIYPQNQRIRQHRQVPVEMAYPKSGKKGPSNE